MSNEQVVDYSLDLDDIQEPVARIIPSEQEVVVGSIVKLDGRSSTDPQDLALTYAWSFSQIPIGSQVELFGFTLLEDDASVVGFAPDITGTYKIQLIVSDGSLTSDPTDSIVDVRVILVPHHQGFIPDASFIWNYLSDFWTQVADRNRFETFWSGAIQIAASEMLKLYQYQYNKSIRDIQEVIQKRWLSFSPALVLDRDTVSFILADDTAGSSASTFIINSVTGLPTANQPNYSNVVAIPLSEGDFTKTSFGVSPAVGRVLKLENRSYTLARTNSVFQSIDYGLDGASSGTVDFAGSQFNASMVGATLRILGPSTSTLLGDYVIASYVSPVHITIVAAHPGVTWTGHSNLEYTILPAAPKNNAFFADRLQVPAGLDAQHWRLSSTLVSSVLDFEASGVSPGDIIQIEVTRTDLQVLSVFYAQVVSVDRNRLGFVLNLVDLVDGIAAGSFTEDIQVTLSSDLMVSGLSADSNGSLTYNLDAATIKSLLASAAFKRTYFEKALTPTDVINIGPFSVVARPIQIIRNKKMAIDPVIVSVPILQEYIKQPFIIEDQDQIFFMVNGVKTQVSRKPYLLAENLDYVIDDESMISGICTVQVSNDEILIPHGDLIDRSIQEGDTIEISIGVTSETFSIRRIISADTIRVFPVPTIGAVGALFTLTRRVPGKFIRFIGGAFTKTSPASLRLWSEVSYLDNGDAIEGNFGVLVGIKREDLAKVGSGIPYKSAVAGLMYALSNGPTISNLNLSAQILLGLPFAQNAGVIKEIDPGFRKRGDGSPLFGRILIDGRDIKGNPTGVTNIYFYPEGRQVFDIPTSKWIPALPNLSGVAINPDTGLEYQVGDAVTQFAPLSKGVQIQEYLSTPDWLDRLIAQGNIASILQKYHSFEVLVNADLVRSADVDLVSQFMLRVKAHYVRLTSGLLKSLEDNIDIQDDLSFQQLLSFYDSSDMGTPTAVKFTQNDSNEAYLSIGGIFYTRYHVGTDLVTTKDSPIVTSVAAGFKNARISPIEASDPPKLRPGDLLLIVQGSNAGSYTVVTVNSDSSITLDLTSINFETKTNQIFQVYRPVINPIFVGTVDITTSNAVVPAHELTGGAIAAIGSAGVAVGDTLVFGNLGTLNPVVSKRYTITEVNPGGVAPNIRISPVPAEATATYTAWIIRKGLIAQGVVSPYGSTGEHFYVNIAAAADYINFVDAGAHINSWLNLSMLRPGDSIVIDSVPYTVLRYEPVNRRALVTPPLLTTATDKQVTVVLRPDRPTTVVSIDFLDRFPSDSLQLDAIASLSTGDLASTTATSKDVTLTVENPTVLNAHAGDALVLLAGADSAIDIGFGPGVYPIHKITGGTTFHLMDALTATGTFRYGLRRKLPNEG